VSEEAAAARGFASVIEGAIKTKGVDL